MVVLGDVRFTWDASHREVNFIRWKKNAYRNFKGNKNSDKENQSDFFLDWLGATCEREVESQLWSGAEKENLNLVFEQYEQKCHLARSQSLCKRHFSGLN